MRTRKIGSLDVTVVGVGCTNFGRQLDAEATGKVIHAALDEGVNFFDTADTYGNPKTTSELFVGEFLRGHRDEVIISTKFGRVLDEDHQGAKPTYVKSATEASLRRLQTDYIDLMQLHIPDPSTPIEDTLGALEDLVAEGKIREIGASNFRAEELREAADAAAKIGSPHFVSTQDDFSMLNRTGSAEILAECERLGIAFLPFRPLYDGLLTGKYRPGEPPPPGTRIGDRAEDVKARLASDTNMATLAALTEYAQDHGHTILELAISWLLGHTAIPSVIAGVSNPAQLVANVAAAHWELSAVNMAEIAVICDGIQ